MIAENTTRVWFYNVSNWGQVFAYAFYGDPEQRPLGDWPGTQAVKEGTSQWYFTDVPLNPSTTPFTMIFVEKWNDNGNWVVGNQTIDTLINSDINVYVVGYDYPSGGKIETWVNDEKTTS